MNRQQHLDEAAFRLEQAKAIRFSDPNGAGEFTWGATSHAISTADPEHERQTPDRFGNPHPAPVAKATLIAAGQRIAHPQISSAAIARYLEVGQKKLHNHFYHLNLKPMDQAIALTRGLLDAEEIVAFAKTRVRPQGHRQL